MRGLKVLNAATLEGGGGQGDEPGRKGAGSVRKAGRRGRGKRDSQGGGGGGGRGKIT